MDMRNWERDNGPFPPNSSLAWRIARVRNLSVDGVRLAFLTNT